MNDDERAFLKAIWRKPNDMTARLVYADWLDEHGYGWEADAVRYWARLEERERKILRAWLVFSDAGRAFTGTMRLSRRAIYGMLDLDRIGLIYTRWRGRGRGPEWRQYIRAMERIFPYS
jgi:uncharacterized protein (TIGR02996 family)